jgi:PAS domain S-box-containing protein
LNTLITIPEYFVLSRQFYYTQIGTDGKCICANPYFFETFDYDSNKIHQNQFIYSVHPDDVEIYSQAINESINNPGKAITAIFRKSIMLGNYAHTKWEFTSISDANGDDSFIQCLGVNITGGIKGAQHIQPYGQKLNASVDLVETLLCNSVDVILVSDIHGTLSFCSPNIKEEMGYNTDELIGKNGFDFVHPDDLDKAFKALENEVLNSGKNSSVDLRFRAKDGSWIWFETKGKNLLHNPILQGLIINLNKISSRKEAEEALFMKERTRQMQIAQAAINAQEKERADIGKELHDNVSQMLTSTKLFLDILRSKTPDDLLDRSIKNINIIIAEIRNISRSLVPSSIEDLGLIASLNDLFDNIRISNILDFEFYPEVDIEAFINPNHKLTLYRLVQEQINNIIKHASASKVVIELFHDESLIQLIIKDDGQGFDLFTVKKGHGLKNMRSRAELLNGTIEIITAPGKGCKLKVHIPYQ